jgi:hypothetical protein
VNGFVLSPLPELGTMGSKRGGVGATRSSTSSTHKHEITEKLPNAKLEVINKAGHYVHMDKPQELVQVMAKFLDEVPDEVARLASN